MPKNINREIHREMEMNWQGQASEWMSLSNSMPKKTSYINNIFSTNAYKL